MIFRNYLSLTILLIISSLFLSRILQFFTKEISSEKEFFQRLKRVTRFDSEALVAGGLPIAGIMTLLFGTHLFWAPNPSLQACFSFTLFVLIGIVDDVFELRSLVKLFCQSAVAVLWSYGVYQGGEGVWVGLIFLFLSLALTNSVNLLDGIDTLSTRLAQIGLIYYCVLSFSLGLFFEVATSLFLLTGLTTFSRFNRGLNPLYLGETGVNVISVTYLYLSLSIYQKACESLLMQTAAFIALLPLTYYGSEIFVSFSRRLLNGRSPFAKDSLHFHHILTQKYGHSPYKSAYMMGMVYFGSISLGALCHFILNLHALIALGLSFFFSVGVQCFLSHEYWSIRPFAEGFGGLIFRRPIHNTHDNVVSIAEYRNNSSKNDEQNRLAS